MGSKPTTCPHGITPKNKCKKCNNERQKQWRKKNPEKRKKIRQNFHQKHREKELQYSKEYYRKHRKEILERAKLWGKQYRATHRDKLQKYFKNYHEKNRERKRQYHKEWYKRSRRKVLQYQKDYCSSPEVKEKRRKYSRDRYNYYKQKVRNVLGTKCAICGREGIEQNKLGKPFICYHEIHGKPHRCDFEYILKHKEDFICLCWKCHRIIHRLAIDFDKLEIYIEFAKKIIEE